MRFLLRSPCLLAVFAQLAFAQTGDILEQLRSGHFRSVETRFSTVQTDFEKGRVTEFDLLDAYKVFYRKDDNLRTELNAWVTAYPESSSAYLARGAYFRKLGEFKRGTNYISQTPAEDVRYMTQMFDLAKKDLGMALQLNPKSYLAALHLLNIAQFEGDDDAANTYLRLGNSLLPSNFLVRARYLIHLTPRWGGSYPRMDHFISQCLTDGLNTSRIDLLRAIELDDQGRVLHENGDWEKARPKYLDALRLSISGGSRFRRDYLSASMKVCSDPQHGSKEYCQ